MSDTQETKRILNYIIKMNGDCNELELQVRTFVCRTCPLLDKIKNRCEAPDNDTAKYLISKEKLAQIEKLDYLEKL